MITHILLRWAAKRSNMCDRAYGNNAMTMQQIGALIRRTRKALGLTQGELASVAGVGVRTLSEMENGKETAHIGLVLKVLESLGIELQLVPLADPGADAGRGT